MRPWIILCAALLFAAPFLAEPVLAEPVGGPAANREILRMGLYPPDILMRHQQTLGVTDEQRKAIAALVRRFQDDIADLQWTLQNEQQIFAQALDTHPVADDTLAQAEKVLALESRFKLAHFRLLIAIKNALTAEQVAIIDQTLERRRNALKR